MVHRHRRHRGHRRLARRDLRDRGAELQLRSLRAPPGERRQAVGPVRLGRPNRVEAKLLYLGNRIADARRRPPGPVAGVEAQLQGADATTSSLLARFELSTIASTIFGQSGRGRSWPVSSSSSSRAPGIALAVAFPPDGEISLSSLPWITTVGAVTRARRRLRLRSAVIAASWRPVPAMLTPRCHESSAVSRTEFSSNSRFEPIARNSLTDRSTISSLLPLGLLRKSGSTASRGWPTKRP